MEQGLRDKLPRGRVRDLTELSAAGGCSPRHGVSGGGMGDDSGGPGQLRSRGLTASPRSDLLSRPGLDGIPMQHFHALDWAAQIQRHGATELLNRNATKLAQWTREHRLQ